MLCVAAGMKVHPGSGSPAVSRDGKENWKYGRK